MRTMSKHGARVVPLPLQELAGELYQLATGKLEAIPQHHQIPDTMFALGMIEGGLNLDTAKRLRRAAIEIVDVALGEKEPTPEYEHPLARALRHYLMLGVVEMMAEMSRKETVH